MPIPRKGTLEKDLEKTYPASAEDPRKQFDVVMVADYDMVGRKWPQKIGYT
jgi:hypothetical protein